MVTNAILAWVSALGPSAVAAVGAFIVAAFREAIAEPWRDLP